MIRLTHCKPSNVNVSVIGFPGINSGSREHVGKSCLINRFMSHLSYCENHISIVSLSDFDGEVICGSHWLYWGEGIVTIGDNFSSSIRIIEQCDFVDDHLFYPISVSVPYTKRCLNMELVLHSRKLAYVCKDQLGHEDAFPRSYLEPGTFHINVFVCVYDMTLTGSSAFQQASFLQQVLLHLSSSKIPAVLATSKHDGEVTQVANNLLENVLKSVKKRWIRRHFCIVETSARLNINVNKVFQCAFSLALTRNNDRSKNQASQLFRLLRNSDTSKTQKLKNSIDSKLQHFYYEAPACVPVTSQTTQPGRVGFGGFPSYSYCQTECSSLLQNNIWKSDLVPRKDLKCPLTPLLPNVYTPNCYSPIPQPDTIQTPKPCFPTQCPSNALQCPLNLTLKPGDSSVLPTPPPLLLPGPRSPGLFGPVSCPSFFESPKSVPDRSHDGTAMARSVSAMDYPLARLYVHGSIETVDAITKALTQSCPLDRYHTKLGRRYRVWIFSGSKPDEYKTPRNTSTPTSLSGRRPDFLSIRPAQTHLNKSQISAFSAPNQSPVESSPDFPVSDKMNDILTTTRPPTTPINNGMLSCPISPVNEIKGGPISNPQSSVQLCLHISTYSTAVELQTSMSFLDSIDANCKSDHSNQPATYKAVKFLVYWCLFPSSTDMIDLMLRGIHLTSRAKIPLIVVDQKSSPCLLSHLLDLASTGQPSESSPIYCDQLTSPIDLTCLLPSLVQQLSFELILSPKPYLTPNEFGFGGILASLIFHDRHPFPTDTDQSLSSQSHSTTNRLFFLSPTVAAPTAIRIKPSTPTSNLASHQCSSCFGPRFLQLEQAVKILQDHLSFGQCSTPSTYYNILIIHCNASQWINQQKQISHTIETLLAVYSSPSPTETNSTPCQSSCLIMLVIVNKEPITNTSSELSYLQCLNSLLQTYQTTLLLPPNSSLQSTERNSATNRRSVNTTLPAIPPDLSSNSSHQTFFKTTSKTLLGILFVSPLDPASKNLYKRIFEGDLDGWYTTDKFSSPLINSPATTAADVNTSFSQPKPFNSPPSSASSNAQNVSCPSTSVYDTIPNLNTTAQTCSGMVELPWLPLSPADALRIPSFDTDKCHVLRPGSGLTPGTYFAPKDYPLVSTMDTDRIPPIPAVPSSSGFWTDSYRTLSQSLNDPTRSNMNKSSRMRRLSNSLATESCSLNSSSVEEYYAELPKITQPNVFKLEYQRPHPDRPKRPLPRTASVNSHSSQSSSPLLNGLNPSTPSSTDHPIPSVHYGDCDFDKTPEFKLTCSPTHLSINDPIVNHHLPNDEDASAVYAEVNDALVYKEPSESCLPQLPPPRTIHNSIQPNLSLCYHYDYPYNGPSLTASLHDPTSSTTHTPRPLSAVRPNSPLLVQNNGSTKSCKARFFKSDSPQPTNYSRYPDSNSYNPAQSDSCNGHPSLGGRSHPPPIQPAPPPPPPFVLNGIRHFSSISNFSNPCQSYTTTLTMTTTTTTTTMCGHHSSSAIGSSNAYHVSDIPSNADCVVRTAAAGGGGGCLSSWHCQQSERDSTFTGFQTFPPYCDNKQTTSSDSNTNSSASVPSQTNHTISSTLDSLTAAFKRHGVWLRHSTTRRSRKSKA